jgi:hypothetical protein
MNSEISARYSEIQNALKELPTVLRFLASPNISNCSLGEATQIVNKDTFFDKFCPFDALSNLSLIC